MSAPVGAPPTPMEPPSLRRDVVALSWTATSTLGQLGDAAASIALVWTAVHTLTPAAAGLVVGVQALSQGLCMLAGGVIADRFDTRRVLITTALARVVVLLVAAAVWGAGAQGSGVLAAVAAAAGIAAGLGGPARATMARQLVRDTDLPTLIGWVQVSARLAVLIGAPVGAAMVSTVGFGPALLVTAAAQGLVATMLVALVRLRYRPARGAAGRWTASVREGWEYLRHDAPARTLVLGMCAMNLFVAPVTGIGVSLRVSQAGWGAAWVGIADACVAVGAIVGSLVAIRYASAGRTALAFRLLAVQGAAIMLVGLPSRATLVVGMATIGLVAGVASVWLSTAFQRTVAPTRLGRVASVSQLGDLALTPLVLPAFGALAAATDIAVAAAACGATMCALCLVLASRPVIRSLR